VIRETDASKKVDFTSKYTLTESQALDAGIKYVGESYSELNKVGSSVFRAKKPYLVTKDAEFYKQFRMDEGSIVGAHPPNVPHLHLQIVKVPVSIKNTVKGNISIRGTEQKISNNHIPIIK
jgi:hypothetical protein